MRLLAVPRYERNRVPFGKKLFHRGDLVRIRTDLRHHPVQYLCRHLFP